MIDSKRFDGSGHLGIECVDNSKVYSLAKTDHITITQNGKAHTSLELDQSDG